MKTVKLTKKNLFNITDYKDKALRIITDKACVTLYRKKCNGNIVYDVAIVHKGQIIFLGEDIPEFIANGFIIGVQCGKYKLLSKIYRKSLEAQKTNRATVTA